MAGSSPPPTSAGRLRLTTFGPYVANLGYDPLARDALIDGIRCGGTPRQRPSSCASSARSTSFRRPRPTAPTRWTSAPAPVRGGLRQRERHDLPPIIGPMTDPSPGTVPATSGSVVAFEHVTKRYGDGPPAVTDLSLEIGAGEVCVLVGPSGCGKTTTMKMVNRLVEPTSGRVTIDGEDVASLPPVELRRRIGYVIQQVGLFPHLTVGDNVAVVPRLLGWSAARAPSASRSSSSWWASNREPTGTGIPRLCPAGSASGWAWRGPWPPTPPSCSWTSRSARWTPSAASGSRTSSSASRRGCGRRSCSSPTTWTRRSRWPTGSRSSRSAACWPNTTPRPAPGAPADEFVERFVGADRGLKRLSLARVGDLELEPRRP